MADISIFRIDHHGSLVRPPELLAAHSAGATGDELRAIEDSAIHEAVALQRRLRLTEVTDGQFRREDFRDVVLRKVRGFAPAGGADADGLRSWTCTGPLEADGALVVDDLRFIEGLSELAMKATLPSPAYLAAHTWSEATAAAYPSPADLGMALAGIIRAEIVALLDAGVRYIQLDNPDYSAHYSGPEVGGSAPQLGVLDAIAIDAAVLEGVERPEDARIGICVDWGEYPAGDADEQVAWEVFGELPYDRFSIPFHDDAFVGQQLLQFIPEGKAACLGIVDARHPDLESVDEIMDRMDRAFELKHVDEVAVSPNRGFQDAAYLPAALTIEEQRKKLTHVETIARMAWGNEL